MKCNHEWKTIGNQRGYFQICMSKCDTVITLKINNKMENQKILSLIEELKKGLSEKEIKKIEKEKEDIIWWNVDEETKDLWYETLGDAKKGIYN